MVKLEKYEIQKNVRANRSHDVTDKAAAPKNVRACCNNEYKSSN